MMPESQPSQSQPEINELQRYQRTAKELLSQLTDAPCQLQVISESMLPVLLVGDMIVVESAQAVEYQIGDIVVCMQSGRENDNLGDWVVHRLVGKSSQGWLTKGDHVRAFDFPIQEDAVLGRVIQIVRGEKHIDLQRFPQNLTNRCLGLCHYGLGFLFTILRKLRGRVKSV